MDRFSRSWALLKESWAVLKENKTLAVFPILSGISCILVLATFVGTFLAMPGLRELLNQNRQIDPKTQAVLWVLGFLYYFVNYFVIVFFNTALVSCAIMHFHGHKATFGDGISAAMARLPQILGWALLSATIGIILKAIEERFEFIGSFVADILGMVWTAVTYLVVPILAVEKLGPIAATKRSAQLLKECWGEGLITNLGLGLIGFLLYLPGFAFIVLGVVLGAAAAGKPNLPIMFGMIGIGVFYLLTVAIVMSTLQQITVAGLYLYASEQKAPDAFSQELMEGAFTRK